MFSRNKLLHEKMSRKTLRTLELLFSENDQKRDRKVDLLES